MSRTTGKRAGHRPACRVGRAALLIAPFVLASAGCDTTGSSELLAGLAEQIGANVADVLSNLIEAGLLSALL